MFPFTKNSPLSAYLWVEKNKSKPGQEMFNLWDSVILP